MSFIDFILNYLKNPNLNELENNKKYLRKLGFLGYFLGYFTLFFSLKIMWLVPGSYLSFSIFFIIFILLSYIFTAIINLFMDMLGYQQSSSNVFYYFGLTEFVWLLSLPLSFLVEIKYLSSFFAIFLLLLISFLLKLKMIKLIYKTVYKFSLIAFLSPFLIISLISSLSFFYFIYWAWSFLYV